MNKLMLLLSKTVNHLLKQRV